MSNYENGNNGMYAVSATIAMVGYAILLFALFDGWFPNILPGVFVIINIGFVVGFVIIYKWDSISRTKVRFYEVK